MNNSPSDRQIKSDPYPSTSLLTEEDLFHSSSGLSSISLLKRHLQEEGRLDEKCALRLIEFARRILEHEPNILKVQRPVTIVADIHGQFYDLFNNLSSWWRSS